MGRLIAIILGGAALAFYVPVLLPDLLGQVSGFWKSLITDTWYDRVKEAGAGLLAGAGLVLLAVRSSKE
jgi:hypothetical protein